VTLEEMLESFYVDAGLTDEPLRAELAPEGNVERWLWQARLKIGVYEEKSATLWWEAGDTSLVLPPGLVRLGRIVQIEGCLPAHDQWGLELAFRDGPATEGGSVQVYYESLFNVEPGGTPMAESVGLAYVSYALSRFFRALASSRSDFKRYTTVTGQAGIEAGDLQDLAREHLADFEGFRNDLAPSAPTLRYGD